MKKKVILSACAFIAAVFMFLTCQNAWTQDFKVPPVLNNYHVDSLEIIPEIPYSNDEVLLVAYTTHSSGGCGLKGYKIYRYNNFIFADATYWQGMLTYICHSADTIELGNLSPDNYFLLFDLMDTISFTVYPAPQECRAFYTYEYPKCLDGKCINTVAFRDSSAGKVTSRLWDFGDGNTSKEKDPVHQYENAGIYEVCLDIECEGGCTSTYCDTVLVGVPDECKADFEVIYPDCYENDIADCITNHVAFLDKSTGKVNQWFWDFGDGDTSTVQNPVHFYKTPGVYNVCLTIHTIYGCSDTYCDTVFIWFPECKADFTWSPLRCGDSQSRCYGGYKFTDLSYPEVVNWYWEFGDGDTSTLQDPVHFYKNDGVYPVSLSIETKSGCTDRKTDTLVMGDTTITCCKANFGWQEVFPNQDCYKKSTNCITPYYYIQFTDSSTGGILGWSWDFGDGTSSEEQNIIHEYKYAGTYNVCLTIKCEGWCYDVICKTVTVGDTIPGACEADFAISDEIIPCPKCAGCYCVKFLDRSSWNTVDWYWSFGDGDTSTLQNPDHMFTWYPGDPLFNVCLIIKTSDNCTDSICKTFNPVGDTLIMHVDESHYSDILEVFPNPADNIINIALPEEIQGKECTVSMIDMYGRTIDKYIIPAAETLSNTLHYNVAKLSNGQYICILVSDQFLNKGRFIVEKR
ncbi:MAG: PKD domain-containing protein [Bacteroidales bacterium]|nr:PKD domain-containing protein [Bacteroidales bacterium]